MLLVCSVASLNTKHAFIETDVNDYDDDVNMTEICEDIGKILFSLTSKSFLIPFTCLMNY